MKAYTLQNQFIKETSNFPRNFTGIAKYYNGSKAWYFEGKYHRLDGPACEWVDGTKKWYVYNEEVTEKQCKLLYSIMKLKGLI